MKTTVSKDFFYVSFTISVLFHVNDINQTNRVILCRKHKNPQTIRNYQLKNAKQNVYSIEMKYIDTIQMEHI